MTKKELEKKLQDLEDRVKWLEMNQNEKARPSYFPIETICSTRTLETSFGEAGDVTISTAKEDIPISFT